MAGGAAVMFAWTPDSANVQADQRAPQSVIRASFAHDRLWMLGDDGSLVSLRPETGDPEAVENVGRVADLCRLDGGLVILSKDQEGQRWLLRRGAASSWGQAVPVPTEGDTLIALSCDEGRITLVTDARLIEIVGTEQRSMPLSERIAAPLVTSTALATTAMVWVGFNNGEWGGGLARIDRQTGQVQVIERNNSGDLCGGPLNSECDPVNGIAVSPRDASCVVAAIGLEHMMSHGRLVEVCGSLVHRLYFKPLDPQPPHGTLDEGEPPITVAFYGLVRSGDTLWSAGTDGIYRFSEGHVEIRPLPQFQNRGGFLVSFDVPGIALVMADTNQRAAMSGSVPIMAIR